MITIIFYIGHHIIDTIKQRGSTKMASHDALQYRCLHTITLVSAKHFNSTSTIASYTLYNAKDPVV